MNNVSSPTHIKFAVLAADIAAFTLRDGQLYVRMIDVNRPPYYTHVPGLPGGLLNPDETAEEAATRHLKEKAGIDTSKIHLEQLYTFSEVKRDKRGRVVAVAYLALVPWESLSTTERTDSQTIRWVPVHQAKKLAYDHDLILQAALKRLASRVTYTTLISALLPTEFTLGELENAFATIIGKKIDKRNFRKKLMKLELLKELSKQRRGERWRPAKLYSFRTKKIEEIEIL